MMGIESRIGDLRKTFFDETLRSQSVSLELHDSSNISISREQLPSPRRV
jgi:hypothetical protein